MEFLPGTEGSLEPLESLEEEEDEEVVEEEEEEEGEEAMEDDTSPWRSRNGKLLWSLPFFPPPILTLGPTHYALARISSTETAFDLFFPEDILQLIQHFTNLQGRRSVNEWIDLIEEELQAYLKLMILAGMFRSQHESTN